MLNSQRNLTHLRNRAPITWRKHNKMERSNMKKILLCLGTMITGCALMGLFHKERNVAVFFLGLLLLCFSAPIWPSKFHFKKRFVITVFGFLLMSTPLLEFNDIPRGFMKNNPNGSIISFFLGALIAAFSCYQKKNSLPDSDMSELSSRKNPKHWK